MRFLLDENVSYRVAGHLKAAGHEAVHVSEIGLTNTDDAVILSRAQDEDWVLVTGDHDFVQMLFASGGTSPSLILVRDVRSLRAPDMAAPRDRQLDTGPGQGQTTPVASRSSQLTRSGRSLAGSQTGSRRPQDPGDPQRRQATKGPAHGHAGQSSATPGDAMKSPAKQ